MFTVLLRFGRFLYMVHFLYIQGLSFFTPIYVKFIQLYHLLSVGQYEQGHNLPGKVVNRFSIRLNTTCENTVPFPEDNSYFL